MQKASLWEFLEVHYKHLQNKQYSIPLPSQYNKEINRLIILLLREDLDIRFIFSVVTVDFSSPTYTVREDDGNVEVCLSTNTASNEPVTVVISTAPKTATCEYGTPIYSL